MSSWTTTVPNSVRNNEPVGHTSRHAAWVQCLQTSLAISQRNSELCSEWGGAPTALDAVVAFAEGSAFAGGAPPARASGGIAGGAPPAGAAIGLRCSMNAT